MKRIIGWSMMATPLVAWIVYLGHVDGFWLIAFSIASFLASIAIAAAWVMTALWLMDS